LKPATLEDVAAAAGVSMMTVSNVLLGRTERVGVKTKERIEKEIVRLNYRPHSMARSLRNASWSTVGMLVADNSPTFLATRFISSLVAGLSNHLTANDFALLLQGCRTDGLREALVVRNIRADGICSTLAGSDSTRRTQIQSLLKLGQPLVLFQENLRFPGEDLCTIRVDDRGGGKMLAEEVINAGARRMILLGIKQLPPGIAQRLNGIQHVVDERSPGLSLRVVQAATSRFEDIQKALSDDIDQFGLSEAIFGMNDDFAVAALNLLKSRGIKVPKDVMVTGFNAIDTWRQSDPVLTTIRVPAYEMGARAGEEMLLRLRRGSFRESDIVLPVEFVRGGST
jgi:LacI family transcriptional regulator